jgi:fructokinase
MRIGIDLGGSKTEVIALNDQGGELLRRRVVTPAQSYGEIVGTIVTLVNEAERQLGQKGSVGIGTPGAISPATNLIKNSNTTVLIGKPLKQDLEKELRREIGIANDADCFALSEATDGAAAGASIVFGVIIGTGTGGGFVVNGRVLAGANAIAGEWGHNPLPWLSVDEYPGRKCYCGRLGCIETFLSGPALSFDHEKYSGEKLTAPQIAEAAFRGESNAEATLRRYENRMARALASVINVVDPHVIVLGGGVSNIKRLYKTVPELWSKWVFSDRVETKLVPAKFGDSSGVRGAAWL